MDKPQRQPEYGQAKTPEFGALAAQFPSDYNPYVYGLPDEPVAQGIPSEQQIQQSQGAVRPSGAAGYPYTHNPYSSGQESNQGPSQQQPRIPGWQVSGPQGNGLNSSNSGQQPRLMNGIDVNDPRSNPLYGHWDGMAIAAFVFAVIGIPILPALMGLGAMWRTRTFHMKGFWLALFAVIICVALTILAFVLVVNGITTDQVYQWLMAQFGMGSSDGGTAVTA